MILSLVICFAACAMVQGAEDCQLGDYQQKDFDPKKFSGVWYAAFQPPEMYKEYKHWVHTFSWEKEGPNPINLSATCVRDGNAVSHTGTWEVTEGAKFVGRFGEDFDGYNGMYKITATDYSCYAVLQGCPKQGVVKDLVWIQFRDEHASDECVNAAAKAMEEAGLDIKKLERDPSE
ncbi:hypothetical protein C0J52_07877 [Blattella germanica]|nr:hypothetical protein C0J52_07877 [Blattella germanica]